MDMTWSKLLGAGGLDQMTARGLIQTQLLYNSVILIFILSKNTFHLYISFYFYLDNFYRKIIKLTNVSL